MDKYSVQKVYDGIYQIIGKKGEFMFEGSISDCYAWIRLMEINILE